ncbi:MAG: Mu-like prophage major head subunit gpT family protein [Aquabacterium sp.]
MILNQTTLAALAQAVDMRFNAGLARATTPWDFLAMTVPSVTAENIYPYLKELGNIREWLGDREIQNIAKGEFRIANKDFEETHQIPRKAVDDDTYGLYGPMFEQTGLNVASFPAEQVFATLKAGFAALGPDGQYFFDTDHPVGSGTVSNFMGGAGEGWFIVDAGKVFKPIIWQPRKSFEMVRLFDADDPNLFFKGQLIWGVDGRAGVGYSPFWQLAFASKQTLDATNVRATLVAMASQRGDTGKPLKVMGTHIVVGPALAEVANDLFVKERLANGEDNTLRGRLQVVVAPELL